jgi:hypothetical protein
LKLKILKHQNQVHHHVLTAFIFEIHEILSLRQDKEELKRTERIPPNTFDDNITKLANIHPAAKCNGFVD